MLENKQLSDIGFAFITEKLAPWSPFGEELARRVKPYSPEEKAQLLREIGNMRLLARAYGEDPSAFGPAARILMQFKDVRRSVARSRETALSDIELFEIKRFLMLNEELLRASGALPVMRELSDIAMRDTSKALDIVDPDGMRAVTFRLGDSLSEELAAVRRERRETDLALRSALPEEKDALSSKRMLLAAREENEEQRLRSEMTKKLAVYADELEAAAENIARFDFSLAKARLMLALGGAAPVFNDDAEHILFKNMVNPMIGAALREKGRSFTPVSVELFPGPAVITGANMGGKSVAVKTMALNAYLALSGMPVFAEYAELPHLSDIFLLSEDMEDSMGGLSSFGGEMVRFDSILAATAKTPGALVLIDEFARGTNPHEGSVLVRAAVRYFAEKGDTYAVLTTHFDDVACLAKVRYQVMGLRSADEAELNAALSGSRSGVSAGELLSRFMDYGLVLDESGANPPRDAVRICRALGISADFMKFVND